jgi:hypothetical protein
VDESVENPELVEGGYLFTLETRTLDDIRALGCNSPADDRTFATVARVSEINQGLYRTLLGPTVSALANEATAEWSRRLHPNRARFEMFADENPLMGPVAASAQWVRDNRRTVSPGNPFLGFERVMSDMIATGLEAYAKARDIVQEAVFFGAYGSPLLQAMVGLGADGSTEAHSERDLTHETIAARTAAELERRIEQGGVIEATVRALIYIRRPEGTVDERGFAMLKQISAELPAAKRIGFGRFKEIVREQFLILFLDEERAITALTKLLPEDHRERATALSMLRRMLSARGSLSPEALRRLQRIEALFDLPAEAKSAAE